jgi:uncharacterized membrane protein YbhN (UPF0104 family)
VIGLGALVWIALLIDLERLILTLRTAQPAWLLVLLLAIAAEQLVRAWKWRQILHPVKPITTLRLFGAIMAGYLANILVPLGMSPLVRAWLIARLDDLKMSAVLATVAIDRFIDGIVFTGFVALVLAFAVFPDPGGNIRLGLVIAGFGTFALFAGLLAMLAWHKRRMQALSGRMFSVVERLPVGIGTRLKTLLLSFADGIVWPRAHWRRYGILLASIVIKIIATTHFLWAGLAFGVLLKPIDYVFLLVFAGFAHILAHVARVPGGFIVGSIFALGLLNVPKEEAVAMVASVQIASMATVAAIGAVALWREGIALSELRANHGAGARSG